MRCLKLSNQMRRKSSVTTRGARWKRVCESMFHALKQQLLLAHLHRNHNALVATHNRDIDSGVGNRAPDAGPKLLRSANRDMVKFNDDVAVLDARQIRGATLRNTIHPYAKEFRSLDGDALRFTIVITKQSLAFRTTVKNLDQSIVFIFRDGR